MSENIKNDKPAPLALMEEALDTIKATFWVQNAEYLFAEAEEAGYNSDYDTYEYDWSDWETVNKFISAGISDDYRYDLDEADNKIKDGKAKVTGVCSIGALALAEVTLYDQPLQPFESRASWDLPLYLTGVALAKVIWNSESYRYVKGQNPSYTIASWNDTEGRTRDEVIEAFEKALKDPLLQCEKDNVPFEIIRRGAIGEVRTTFWIFATETEAQAFLDDEGSVLNQRYPDNEYEIRLMQHSALTTA